MQTWSSFKLKSGDARFANALRAIDGAVGQLHEYWDGGIAAVVLFGSLARAQPMYDDIDLLIVTSQELGSASEVTRRMAEKVFGPSFLEHGELFSFLVYTRQQIARLQGELPLLDVIRREGVLIYGEDPFVEVAGASIPADLTPATGDG